MFPSYRNQSTDLHCKSIDSFMYDGNIGPWKVNDNISTDYEISCQSKSFGIFDSQ